ncbi:MAG: thioesterase family protein [Desulfobacterales bacterium]|nr:thioesterase family protein [Desulfobacterales bacterium]
MKDSLKPGLSFEYRFKVPENKTVPYLYPEIAEGRVMPKVFATGFMVGLFEFACIQAINPHIDWPREQTVGVHVDVSHTAATPPGFTVTVKGRLEKVEGRRLTFRLQADDGVDTISEGVHQRFVIDAEKFNRQLAAKAAAALEKE